LKKLPIEALASLAYHINNPDKHTRIPQPNASKFSCHHHTRKKKSSRLPLINSPKKANGKKIRLKIINTHFPRQFPKATQDDFHLSKCLFTSAISSVIIKPLSLNRIASKQIFELALCEAYFFKKQAEKLSRFLEGKYSI
jgi:hypothetical protein